MPFYLSIYRAATTEQLLSLAGLAEALLGRALSTGITVRNVAVLPRSGHLYVHADAPAARRVCRLFAECGLAPMWVAEASNVQWGRLIGAATRGEGPLEPDDVSGHHALSIAV